VTVSDEGDGIAAEARSRIFTKFWRGGRGRGGTGLGLYIAKGIIEAHGGRVWVDSRLGVGSTFRFTVPSRRP
jgi:signal transduction histidine kinase